MRLTWYILRLHIGPLIFGTSVVIFIFLLQLIFKHINDLVGKGLDYWVIVEFIAYNIAWMLVLAVPMGVLVSTLMAYGKLSGNNELTIVKSSGGSAFRVMYPAILGGAFLAVALFYFNDKILPETNHRAYVLQNDIAQLKPTLAIDAGRFSTLQGYSILARQVDHDKNDLLNVTIYGQDGDYMNVINAKRAELRPNADFSKMLMTLYQGEIHVINRRNRSEYRKLTFLRHQVIIDVSGFNFTESDPKAVSRNDRTMNIDAMRKIADTSIAESRVAEKHIDSILSAGFFPRWKKPVPRVVMRIDTLVPPANQRDIRQRAPVAGIASMGGIPKRGVTRLDTSRLAAMARLDTVRHAIPVKPGTARRPALAKLDTARPATPAKADTVVRTAAVTRQVAAGSALSQLIMARPQLESEAMSRTNSIKDADKYLVEIYKKYSIPAACFVFVFVGAPLGIVVRRGNFGVSAAIALGFFVIYWSSLVAGEKLADRAILSPAVAMWMADGVIGILGIYLTILVSRETVSFAFDFPRLKRWFRRKGVEDVAAEN